MRNVDFVVIGAGIVGLTIALELKRREPTARIVVLEKEREPGRHSSGRNSGVLHSGIYYPPASLKALVCGQGMHEWIAYCEERSLPLNRIGKVLVPTRAEDVPQLDLLEQRARLNGVDAARVNEGELHRLEPEAQSAGGGGIFVRSTSVVSSAECFASIAADVRNAGIEILCGSEVRLVNPKKGEMIWDGERIAFGHAINTAGLHADSIAHSFDVGHDYTLLPFKGLYWKLDPASGLDIRHLVYPLPDLRVPFLGVHTTTAIDGTIYLGPTAVPAFGRENYHGFEGISGSEVGRILVHLGRQYVSGRNGFRRLTWQEGRRYFKRWFAEAAQRLLPRLRPHHLQPCSKVGIRAQMLNKNTGELVTDFLVQGGPRSTHVLNAISPAFTSAFPFARHVCDTFILR
jgi:L-2-hydroxyglutarate oxidase LhgO